MHNHLLKSKPNKIRSFFVYLSKEDRWIPTSIIVFFIALTILLGWFVMLAFKTFPGLVTGRPYERGVDYNQLLSEQAKQEEQGWQLDMNYQGVAGQPSPFTIILMDKDNMPIQNAKVSIIAERLTRYAQAIPASLIEQPHGIYQAPLSLPLGGRWRVRVIAETEQGSHYQTGEITVQTNPDP